MSRWGLPLQGASRFRPPLPSGEKRGRGVAAISWQLGVGHRRKEKKKAVAASERRRRSPCGEKRGGEGRRKRETRGGKRGKARNAPTAT